MDYMKFLKERQKILKSMEDTVCLTMEEAEEISRIIRELEQYHAVGTVEEMQMLKRTTFTGPEPAKIREKLELLEKYKTVGTVEQCRKCVGIIKAMTERGITPETVMEYIKFEDECVRQGYTVAGLLEAGKRMKPKQIVDDAEYGTCPQCGEEFNSELLEEYGIRACPWCGQRLERNENHV